MPKGASSNQLERPLVAQSPTPNKFPRTDGSGKITGVQYARVYFGGASNRSNNYATFVINVTGTIRTGGTARPAVLS